MTNAYDKSYLLRAQKTLGRMLDFACHGLSYSAKDFWTLFLQSGVAAAFGNGESRLLAGMSGIELAYEVLERSDQKYKRLADPVCSDDKITVQAKDKGPGIADIEWACRDGTSTANDWIRSMGFGAGMGLSNSKRVADVFDIQSELGKFTRVTCTFNLKPAQ